MKNKKIMEFLKEIDIKDLNDKKILFFKEAFTHSSYKNENPEIKYDYERLEILGDSIVQKIVTEILFKKHTNYNDGDITANRKKIVQEETMIKASEELNLIDYAFLGKGIDLKNGINRIKGDLFESLIGAIYLAISEKKCEEIINSTIIKYFYDGSLEQVRDYKSELQEILQANQGNKKNKINYNTDNFPNRNGIFKSHIKYKNIIYGYGEGKRKQDAEQDAAKDAINKYMKFNDV